MRELQEVDMRCVRALMRMVLYRAVYDWVLYRSNKNKLKRKEAACAYRWLFLGEGAVLDFYTLCEIMDQDPQSVRAWAEGMDVKTMAALYRGGRIRDQGVPKTSLREQRRRRAL